MSSGMNPSIDKVVLTRCLSRDVEGDEPQDGDAVVKADDHHVTVAGRDLAVVRGIRYAASLERPAVDKYLEGNAFVIMT